MDLIKNPKDLALKIRRNMNDMLVCLNAAENMKRKDLSYPTANTYTDSNGKAHTLRPPRIRLDELHFRAILGLMSTKDGRNRSMVEIYRDEAAYKAHLETPHFRAYKDGTYHWVKTA